MSFKSLMVHIELDRPNDTRIKIAGDLAKRFGAGVIGIAAYREVPFYYSDGYAATEVIEKERQALAARMRAAETLFRGAFADQAKFVEWRSAIADPADFILEQSRAADLVLLGTAQREDNFNPERELDSTDIIVAAGRPALVLPPEVERLQAKCVLIAWKDTREARRAVLDSLPLLSLCQRVIVVEIDEANDPTAVDMSVNDVVVWLSRHGVKAHGVTLPLLDSPAAQLDQLAKQEDADLIIAGAYGHGRFREWILGGMTRDILSRMPRSMFLSH